MKIDLHLHTSEFSDCSGASINEQIEAAINMGLDAIVITDHDCLLDEKLKSALNEEYQPFRIFAGIEIRIVDGQDAEDILVIGVDDNILVEKEWTYPELYDYVTQRGGFIGLAHPYRYRDYVAIDINNYPPHALELYSSNLNDDKVHMRQALADTLQCHVMINSDSHSIASTGSYYNLLERAVSNEKELASVLIAGNYTSYRK